jgi:hypothetical protein
LTAGTAEVVVAPLAATVVADVEPPADVLEPRPELHADAMRPKVTIAANQRTGLLRMRDSPGSGYEHNRGPSSFRRTQEAGN